MMAAPGSRISSRSRVRRSAMPDKPYHAPVRSSRTGGRPSGILSRMSRRTFVPLALAASLGAAASAHANPGPEVVLDVHKWRVIDRESGDVNYYKVVEAPDGAYIHAAYAPPWDTTVLG